MEEAVPKYCQEIVKLTRQQCRNKVYSITETPEGNMYLCRLHFAFLLNDPDFRSCKTWPLSEHDKSNMQLLYDLHDRTKP